MPTLPSEIVSDILRRLPVKSLLRFRCASRPWCSLIDGPDFTKLHLKHSTGQTLILSHSYRTDSTQNPCLNPGQIYSVKPDSLEQVVEINHPLKTLGKNTEVLGSCNGLLCLHNSDAEIVLFNVSTGKHLRLPYTAIIFPKSAALVNMNMHPIAYGFGYDPVHDDYKLLRIVQFLFSFETEVMVYGLKSNSWKKVGGFPYEVPGRRTTGVLASGALHWVVIKPKGGGKGEYCSIIAFDLASEEFRESPELPDGLGEDFFLQVGVLDGCLCVVCNYVTVRAEVWVMKDYGVKESWAKLVTIIQPQVMGSLDYLKPVAYLSNGTEVLFVQNNSKLLLFYLKRNTLKNVRVRGMPVLLDVVVYVESLVNPTTMARGTVGKQEKGRNKKIVAKKRDDFLSKGFNLIL